MEKVSTQNFVIVEATDDAPRIILDGKNYVVDITGPSYPEDAYQTYYIVLDWLEKLKINKTKQFSCNFNFTILSSASHKMVFEILIILEKIKIATNINISVFWKTDELDEDMQEIGEDFQDSLDLNFIFVTND